MINANAYVIVILALTHLHHVLTQTVTIFIQRYYHMPTHVLLLQSFLADVWTAATRHRASTR